jgi:hypothetical protein
MQHSDIRVPVPAVCRKVSCPSLLMRQPTAGVSRLDRPHPDTPLHNWTRNSSDMHEVQVTARRGQQRGSACQQNLVCSYSVTLGIRALPYNPTRPHLIYKLQHFMEYERSLPSPQLLATCPYPKTDQSSPCLASHLLQIHYQPTFYA